jgi:uncharacterized protein
LTLGHVAELWRYPVNGLQGESLQEGTILASGLAGDHIYAIRDAPSGRVLDPKAYGFSWGDSLGRSSMLELSARLAGDPQGDHELLIESPARTICRSSDPAMNTRIGEALGGELELVRFPRFAGTRIRSGRTLHLLTTASLEAMGEAYPGGDFQARRFRPNIVVATSAREKGFVEDGWVGTELSMGALRFRVGKPTSRCKVTTMGQPGIGRDPLILRTIQRENGGNLGVMCTALGEGVLRVGDAVSLA